MSANQPSMNSAGTKPLLPG